jgi:hypothetical protein
LIQEIKYLETLISERKEAIENKRIYNASCAITGYVIPPVWLFIDAKGAEETEIFAFKERQKLLLDFYDRDTDFAEMMKDNTKTIFLSDRLRSITMEEALR